MKMRHQPNSRKQVLLITSLVFLVILAGLLYWYYSTRNPTDSYRPAYDESSTRVDENSDNNSVKDGSNSTVGERTSDEIIPSRTGQVTITSLFQENGFVNAAAEVNDFTVTKCVYQFTSEGARPVTKEQNDNCSPLSIPQVEFEKIGTYQLKVIVYGADSKLSTVRNIDIK